MADLFNFMIQPSYRLAPQYPFPCGLQDVLAAYLFLIDPPPTATHTAVPPVSKTPCYYLNS